MLSVPVPSDIVISPLAMPWSIISSIMKEVSPFGFLDLPPVSVFCLFTFNGDPDKPAPLPTPRLF